MQPWADFIAAANPSAVLALIADLESYKQGAKIEADAGDEARSEVAKLKAENDALKKDAERYRFLRTRPIVGDCQIAVQYSNLKSEFGCLCDGEQLDSIIDASLKDSVQ